MPESYVSRHFALAVIMMDLMSRQQLRPGWVYIGCWYERDGEIRAYITNRMDLWDHVAFPKDEIDQMVDEFLNENQMEAREV